jgi:hypothetical protein
MRTLRHLQRRPEGLVTTNFCDFDKGENRWRFPPFFCYGVSVKLVGLILGVSSLGLLALLLASALKGRFLTRYPFFYACVIAWLSVGLLRFVFFTFRWDHPDEYGLVYWYTQFLLVATGYGVVWQIYEHTLSHYPGTAKMARIFVSSVYSLVLLEVGFQVLSGRAQDLTGSIIRLERNFHAVQAVLLILFVALVAYYSIPLGRNLKSLLLGYGLLVGTRLITLTFRSFLGTSFYSWWYYLEPICILVTLLSWVMGLRSYYPNAAPNRDIERDYEIAARRTVDVFVRARGYLARPSSQ